MTSVANLFDAYSSKTALKHRDPRLPPRPSTFPIRGDMPENGDRNPPPDNHSNSGHQLQERIAPWRLALKSFSSQWFLIPQGTGILSLILHQLHYQFYGLARISQVVWVLNICLLSSFLLIYMTRAILYPKFVANQLCTNIMETSCLASISISFTTIIQMLVINLTIDRGQGWGVAAYGLWWVNLIMAVLCTIGIPYIITRMEAPGIDAVPPGILLPLISALTAAAGGGVICRYGELSADMQVPVILISYLLIGMALPTSLVVDSVVLVRLLDKAFPMHTNVYQLMILCGPLGQGGFALMILGQVVERSADANLFLLGVDGSRVVGYVSQFAGLVTWGYGIFWWGYAVLAVLHQLLQSPRDILKWDQTLAIWSMVFPVGVFTNGAIELGLILKAKTFWVFSTILTVALVLLWLVEVGVTITGVFKGKILGLDRGWKGEYFVNSAGSREKEYRDRHEMENGSSSYLRQGSINGSAEHHGIGMRHRSG